MAAAIAKHRLGFVGFICLDRGQSGREVLLSLPIEKWEGLIPEYVGEDILSDLMKRATAR